jgi:hypothetical protein
MRALCRNRFVINVERLTSLISDSNEGKNGEITKTKRISHAISFRFLSLCGVADDWRESSKVFRTNLFVFLQHESGNLLICIVIACRFERSSDVFLWHHSPTSPSGKIRIETQRLCAKSCTFAFRRELRFQLIDEWFPRPPSQAILT